MPPVVEGARDLGEPEECRAPGSCSHPPRDSRSGQLRTGRGTDAEYELQCTAMTAHSTVPRRMRAEAALTTLPVLRKRPQFFSSSFDTNRAAPAHPYPVEPRDAQFAFLHPFAAPARSVDNDARTSDSVHVADLDVTTDATENTSGRRRRWYHLLSTEFEYVTCWPL